MELSSTVLDTIEISSDKEVMDMLRHTVAEDDIIFESEATEDSVETEVEEIIEIIEEIEEECEEESLEEYVSDSATTDKNIKTEDNEMYEENSQNEQFDKNSTTEIYSFEEDDTIFRTQSAKGRAEKHINNESHNKNTKQVITYDAEEDWQDDDIEHIEEEMDEEVEHEILSHKKHVSENTSENNTSNNVSNNRGTAKSMGADKTQSIHYSENNTDDLIYLDNNVSHEIVKNTENNLVYTVLESKRPNSKQSQEKLTNAHYIKMEELRDNTIPVEGTIYYEGDNMERLYVAHAVEDNDEYQYEGEDQQEQSWEDTVNADVNQNQEEENSQDQIFLHEDEDGQLYFKDDNGTLQPVYLTEDGNYAIAEASDDQDSKESESHNQMVSAENDDDTFIIPDIEVQPARNSKQIASTTGSQSNDLDNEDNTVTISLIISEDENGQKRTQVIIPTTDALKCEICNKSFKTSFQLLRHSRLKHAREEDITTRNFPCDQCPKRYSDQNALARHRKSHTGDRPFQCLECHKNFPTSTALRRHLTLHNSQPRPLPCMYCGRRFLEKASLMKHEESHIAGDHNYTCVVCHKTFMNANDLSMHKKYHDPDKKFDCEVCGREFNRLNNLQRHMMVHQQQGANEEILACDVCGITYKFMSSLTRHMVTTHMNPEKLRQQAEEQRKKRENNYRRYLENRRMYETHHSGNYGKRGCHTRTHSGSNDDTA